ncbi:hypothetical protein [Alloactinosynnema sp. L-07]|nr:hypothetical protein [Alloactinosynnema sp. L-07]
MQGSALSEPDKGGHGGAHGLDGPRAGGDLLHIHAGREIAAGHRRISLRRTAGHFPRACCGDPAGRSRPGAWARAGGTAPSGESGAPIGRAAARRVEPADRPH